jgi:hypothetical protein
VLSATFSNKLISPGTEEFVQFRQVFGLHRLKLHRYLVYGAVKSVSCRQVCRCFKEYMEIVVIEDNLE